MPDGWAAMRYIMWASVLVLVLYAVVVVVLPLWRSRRSTSPEEQLEQRLERLREQHRRQQSQDEETPEG